MIKREDLLSEEDSYKNIWVNNHTGFVFITKLGEDKLVSFDLREYLSRGSLETTKIITQNVSVRKLVCNDSVVHFISNGESRLFSFGNDFQKLGLLGLGEIKSISSPQINPNLANSRIVDISLSQTHCCCVDSKFLIIII
jgi:hypothetical protein